MDLILKGVRQNNLKNVQLDLPLGRTIVVTGPSGSGKSSLAFETIYAEGQRRYMQSLSTYARQFLDKFKAPLVDSITNIPPTVALEQINPVRNSRATVGTTTEIYDYLRVLFEKIGVEYCEKCGIPMQHFTQADHVKTILETMKGRTLYFAFKASKSSTIKATKPIFEQYLRNGYTRIITGKEVLRIDALLEGKTWPKEEIFVLADRIKVEPSDAGIENRLIEALAQSLELGLGTAHLFQEKDKSAEFIRTLTTQNQCPQCGTTALPKTSITFSFNNPLGACERCKGFGNLLEVDENLAIPNPNRSVAQGAVEPFTKPSLSHWQKKLLQFCKAHRIDADLPFKELPEEHRRAIFHGNKHFIGVRGVFKELDEEKYKLRIRVFVSRYNSPTTCPVCKGSRLNAGALRVKIGGLNITDLSDLSFDEAENFFETVELTKKEKEITKDLREQLLRRLRTLNQIGLNYLTLSRLTRTLSGGEYQRILLATQLSQGLTDTLYVLDEPSIGLHPKDTQQLLSILTKLNSAGNTLVVVEHDPEVIEWGQHIVDMGPGSGQRGGEVLFTGSRERFLLSTGQTAEALKDWKQACAREILKPRPYSKLRSLAITGASENNLKKLDVSFPLGAFVTVTGVSGSGKSTLIVDTLYQALAKMFHGKSEKIGKFQSISGFEFLSGVELVDQSAIGRSSRSNPITFVKAYDDIRALFAQTAEAAKRGLSPSHFSFNTGNGRCDQCEGEGRIRVDMVFLEDVWIPCEACQEKRFKPHILMVQYKGKNIDDVLHMTVDEALDFFHAIPKLRSRLAMLNQVGLGYLQLGQPSFTLSGGECQRIKIARQLIETGSTSAARLFILDEPTTGLHFSEVSKLLTVLRQLIARGHSVVVIEHNLQVIAHSDYLIDLGPEGGRGGGELVASGTPKEVAERALPYTGAILSKLLKGA